MSYEKQIWNKYDDLKTEEENIENGAIVTDNRMNHIEKGIGENDKIINSHLLNVNNPHKVTAAQVGLDKVDNVKQASKVEFEIHTSDISNPHKVTAAQIGLDKVENIQQAAKADFDSHVNNKSNPHEVTANQIGVYTKVEIDNKLINKAEDSDVVHKIGDETISGKKSFSDELSVKCLKVPTSSTSTTLGAGISISLERRGEMVIGIITGTINSSLASNQQFGVGTVPYGFRPNQTINIPVHMTSSWNEAHIDIGTDGKGTWWGASTNSGYPRGTQMWFTDDALPT